MKNLVIGLILLLTPVAGEATIHNYDVSLTLSAASLADPRYGDIPIVLYFPVDTEGRSPVQNVNDYPGPFSKGATWEMGYSPRGGMWGISVVSLTEIRFGIGDPGGNVLMSMFYDTPLSSLPFAALLPRPDRLFVEAGSELVAPWDCNGYGKPLVPAFPPCFTMGTGGSQEYVRGEFSFTSRSIPEPWSMILFGVGLLVVSMKLRRA